MLRTLYIRDYALIDELDVQFDAGLNIVTGETGAGKSILIGALKMILGERASTEVVRSGARKAVIEGLFDEADNPAIRALLEAGEIDAQPAIILRREISATQSRAFINDSPATAQLLRDVAANLIDLHGQHEHQSLLRTETHLTVLDNVGALADLQERYRSRYEEVDRLVKERRRLVSRERDLRREKELYEFHIEEIDRVRPEEGEEDELESERSVLENAEYLFEATNRLSDALYESESAVYDALVPARNELQDLARIDAAFETSRGEVESALITVAETAKFLRDYNARIEFNPERLEEIRTRLGDLERLKRKYGGSLEAVIAYRKEIGASYDLAADFEGAIERLAGKIIEAQKDLSSAARELSHRRHEVAEEVEAAIVRELGALGMPHSRFEVRFSLQPEKDGWILPEQEKGDRLAALSSGMDVVEFYISTNLGESPKPLAKVASGGEVSRIMLALKSILARSERLPILVFDEIDTGISGTMARKVGEAMHTLSRFHQIIAITHLPQIAALGDHHFVVEKRIAGERTVTNIRGLEADDRASQIARLISGDQLTDAAIESARQLMLK